MDRNQSSSRRRVPRSDLKKRRPPVACIPCYSRKVKCGREVPTCRRCIAGGLGHACSYRNNSFQETCQTVTPNQDEAIPPAPSFGDENVQSNIPNNEAQPHIGEATGPAQTISSRGMLHFKGRAASTRFYGFSYHLNLYQQVRVPHFAIALLILTAAVRRPAKLYCSGEGTTSADQSASR